MRKVDYFALLEGHIQKKEEIMERLCGLDELWVRFLLRFKNEDDTFERLRQAVRAGDLQKIRDCLHMFKGVAMNLGFSRMTELSSELLNSVSGGVLDAEKFAGLEREYETVVRMLSLAEQKEAPLSARCGERQPSESGRAG